jgi:TetR/AcrR family transcriptional repressor of nem operon
MMSMNKQDTKQTLLENGMSLIFRQGYNNTGLNEILEASGVPKGSFYYYFQSKEDFGLQALDGFIQRNQKRLTAFLEDTSVDPLTKLRNYFNWYADYLESMGCAQGCLLGNLGQELADQNEVFRRKIDEAMRALPQGLAVCLREAQQQGQINPALDVNEIAEFMYNSWQGTLLRMKVTKSMEPVRTFEKLLFDVILKA